MRPIPEGKASRLRILITESMTVDFEQADPRLGKLHPVYATYWLAKHFELVSRKLTLPFLEEHEEGIGFEVSVRHLAPAVPGMTVVVEARFVRFDGKRFYSDCSAETEGGELIASGATTQVITERSELEARLGRLRDSWLPRSEPSGDEA